MDYILLWLSSLTLKLPTKWYRCSLGAIVGSVGAILTAQTFGVWLYVAKLLCLILMCVSTVGFGKQLFWHILLTTAYTFFTGGAIVGIFHLTGNSFTSGLVYQGQLPMFVILAGVLLVIFLARAILQCLGHVKRVAPHLQKVQIVLQKRHVVQALQDSGNCAMLDGLPICFVAKRFAKEFAQRMVVGNVKNATVTTVLGQQKVLVTKGQVCFNGDTFVVYFALSKTHLLYDVILPSQL